MMSRGWGFSNCLNRVRHWRGGMPYCGVHDPVSRAERRRGRGPTKAERELQLVEDRKKFISSTLTLLSEMRHTLTFNSGQVGLAARADKLIAEAERRGFGGAS